MSITEYHQEVFNQYFRPVVFGFMFLTMQTVVFDHPSIVRYGFLLIEWALCQINDLFSTRTSFVIPKYKSSIFCRQDNIEDQKFCCQVIIYISLLVLYRVSPHTLEYRYEGSLQTTRLLHIQGGAWVLSSGMGPCCQFAESNLLQCQQHCLQSFLGIPLANNSVGYNPDPVLGVSLGDKR